MGEREGFLVWRQAGNRKALVQGDCNIIQCKRCVFLPLPCPSTFVHSLAWVEFTVPLGPFIIKHVLDRAFTKGVYSLQAWSINISVIYIPQIIAIISTRSNTLRYLT